MVFWCLCSSNDHTVCEGLRTEYDESTRTMRTYNYFVCPDDPNQPFERYCCTDHRNSGGFCCSYDEKARSYSVSRWGTIAGSIAALAVIALVVAVIYCLCCRRNRRLPSTLVSPTLPTTANGGSGAYPGIPTSTCPYPTVMTSTEQRYTPYPSSGVPLQPGSGWQATPMTQPGFGWANSPPPPYSAK
ncbi:unnamed protein product [Dicrocoelium dendriticum]|nr:unnamed protein product [Dicrocoelium dendriticum]